MKRIAVIAACGLSLAACSSMPSWMQFSLPGSAPAATTMQFESEPAGAEARTSFGQSCQTPCSIAVSSTEFTVTFTRQGYQPQTVPVRAVASNETSFDGEAAEARLVPNPVFVELKPAGAAPRRPAPHTAKPKPTPRPAPTASNTRPPSASAPTAMAPTPPPPEAAPASPWPPAPAR